MEKIKKLTLLEEQLTKCRICPRLVAWREEVARTKRKAFQNWDYWGKPVPGFGDVHGRIIVIGLAPGAHGSNRTGRMFTGDGSGNFLYPALFKAGFANQPRSDFMNDGLTLTDMFITAICRCVPPGNKPDVSEMDACQLYLENEISIIQPRIFVVLGRIAFERIIHLLSLQHEKMTFSHGSTYSLGNGKYLVCSYHPSRQNTQTGRLTPQMFDHIWYSVGKLL